MARPIILWDASGLVKRYYEEAGRETVNAVFAAAPSEKMQITPWGYAETYSILLRKYNGSILNARAFVTATNALQTEVINDPDFGILSITDALIFGGFSSQPRSRACLWHRTNGCFEQPKRKKCQS